MPLPERAHPVNTLARKIDIPAVFPPLSLYSHKKATKQTEIKIRMAFVSAPASLHSLAATDASSRALYHGPLLPRGAPSSPSFTAARSSFSLSTSFFVPRPSLSSFESDAMRFPFRRRSLTTLPVFRPPPFKGDDDFYHTDHTDNNNEHYYPITPTTKTVIPSRTPTEKLRRLVPSCMTQTTPATSAQRTRPYVADTVTFTCIDNNGFMLRYNDTRVLVDPWLTGDLIFNNTKFFRMVKPSVEKVGRLDLGKVSAIVLTQGLPDHTHSETLALFRRDIPIIAPPSSAPVLSALGFTSVLYAEHGQVIEDIAALGDGNGKTKEAAENGKDVGGVISLKCLKGALVGPPWSQRQLALLFTFKPTSSSSSTYTLYHEPHGDHHYPSLSAEKGRVDGVVVPVVKSFLQFPLGLKYPLVYGMPTAVRLCRALRPSTVIGFDNSRGVAEGSLTKMIRAAGGYQTMVDDIDELNRSSGVGGGEDDDMKVKHVIAHADVMVEVALTGDGVGDIIEES